MVNAKVIEDEKGYPDAQNFSRRGLPAYGFYIRYVRNVCLKNVNITPLIEDKRPEFFSREGNFNVRINDK